MTPIYAFCICAASTLNNVLVVHCFVVSKGSTPEV